MLNHREPQPPREALAGQRFRRFGPGLLIAALSLTGLMAADNCGGAKTGGAFSCQRCLDDCTEKGTPSRDCNCQGCTPP
jgi:hypothetical protein